MTIVAVDGVPTEPKVSQSVVIAAGQRSVSNSLAFWKSFLI
jgi:hypothetical protein